MARISLVVLLIVERLLFRSMVDGRGLLFILAKKECAYTRSPGRVVVVQRLRT